jgi:hypothetical protein
VLPSERIAHLDVAKTAALRDFNPRYDRSENASPVGASWTCDTPASSACLFPLSAISAAAPIPIPSRSEKHAVRSSRRNRGVGDKTPNSG